MKAEDNSSIDALLSSSKNIITTSYDDEEMMAEQQPTSASAEADEVSIISKHDDDAAPPLAQEAPSAVTASKTTSLLIVLIAILAVVVIALAVALTRPTENRLQSENQAANTPPPTLFPTPTPTRPASDILNWKINFLELLLDFGLGSSKEITFKYEIGAGRTYQFSLFDYGCTENVTGLNVTTTTVVTPKDSDYDNLDVVLDVMNMTTIATSNIWNSDTSTMEMCIKLQLLSGSGCVIREDARNIGITLDFSSDLNEVILGSGFNTTVYISGEP